MGRRFGEEFRNKSSLKAHSCNTEDKCVSGETNNTTSLNAEKRPYPVSLAQFLRQRNEKISEISERFVEKLVKEYFTTESPVPSLRYYCDRMFHVDAPQGAKYGIKTYTTELATMYRKVAQQNAAMNSKSVMTNILPLKKLCYKMFVRRTPSKLQVKKTEKNAGKFDQLSMIGCGLVRARKQLKETNFLDASVLIHLIQPLRYIQCVLHQDIMTTISFPFRVTLKDLMARNKFNESHARFLCMSMLVSLRHLHSLGFTQGHIQTVNVIFTQHGYPCLTGFESTQTKDCTSKPKIRPRVDLSSPEEILDDPITFHTDVFHIGMLVYYLICRKFPFEAVSDEQTKINLLDETFILKFDSGTLSKDGRYFVRKLLKKDPETRFKLYKCKKPLHKAVKWFSTIPQDDLYKQTFPSPFRVVLMRETLAG